jgi:hypothetical protein
MAFDDGGTFKQYTEITHRLQTKTEGADAGQIFFETAVTGTLANRGYIGAGLGFPAARGDKGEGTINMGSGDHLNDLPVINLPAASTWLFTPPRTSRILHMP